MGMKPIFEDERLFFKDKSGINLPTECWRSGTKIYLDIYCKVPLYKFKIEDKKIKITKDNSESLVTYNKKTIEDIINIEYEKVQNKINNSINHTIDYLKSNKGKDIVVSHSGGKDSTVLLDVFNKANAILNIEDYEINFCNTSNDTADTYSYIKNNDNIPQNKLKILNPKEGFYQWIKRKNYMVPTVLTRNCCSTYKEGQITKEYDTKKEIIFLVGLRKYESTKRAKYEMIMDYNFNTKLFGNNNFPKKWIKFAPIIELTDEDIWVYILKNKLNINNQYYKGYNRCGCLICPYQSDYIDLLTEYIYPTIWKRWTNDILTKSYKGIFIYERFKWSLEEYIQGKWKTGTSKLYEITNKKKTEERVIEVMDILNISDYKIAEKYFDKKCCKCNKKITPTDTGMNLKLFGRQSDISKNGLCSNCICENLNITKKEYLEKVRFFREQGCELF